ncbi:DedA family protein [Pseudoroseomonas cervicalis]|uniref:DedA family protein n=1 Tax=Teichococcus cervicalis TaxID=204525 RepID=UPI00278B3EC2|nr:VTT domain-containing protein [Pseudoroseomonas cervicalis]MDQ1080640.1 membrane protein DedA with SNARE-associated domain [Pseudoroseomonas cervicalis]
MSALDALTRAASLEAVFLAALVEKFIPILPSYVLYPAIGIGAADVWALAGRCLVATAGSMGGALAWYGLGALAGQRRTRALVARHGRWVLLSAELYDRLMANYRRRSLWLTFLGQLIPTVRIFQALPAGVLRLPLAGFLAATALGSLCWIALLAGAGHALRSQGWAAGEAGLAVLGAMVAVEGGVALLAWGLRRRRRAAPAVLVAGAD